MATLRKYGQSLLDQPIGVDEQARRSADDKAIRSQSLERNRIERIGRRRFRDALRSGDMNAAYDALVQPYSQGFNTSNISPVGGERGEFQRQFESTQALLNQRNASLESPNVQMAQPIQNPNMTTGLQNRWGLFSRMVGDINSGGTENSQAFQNEATSLGIDSAGFSRGLERALDSRLQQSPQRPTDPARTSPVRAPGLIGLGSGLINSPLFQSIFNRR